MPSPNPIRWSPPQRRHPAAGDTAGRLAEASPTVFRLVGRLFQTGYRSPDGLPWFAVDGRSGRPLGTATLLPELGDYLPLLAAAGHRDYVEHQGRRIFAILGAGRQPLNPHPGLFPWLRRENPFYHTDLILGLIDCHRLGLGDGWLDLACRQMDMLTRRFGMRGLLCKERLRLAGLRLPVSESNWLVHVESLVELHELTGRADYLHTAGSLLAPWLDLARRRQAAPRYRMLARWPRLFGRWRHGCRQFVLYKHNTGMLSAMWSLAQWLQRPWLQQWCAEMSADVWRFFCGPRPVPCYSVVQRPDGLHRDRPTLKGTLFIDHFCELAHDLKCAASLRRARRLAAFWLDQQDPDTDLIAYRLGGRATDVDSLTDFSVSLLKLHALTGQARWHAGARRIVAAVIRYHMGPHGLFLSVDKSSGRLLHPRVETRYTSLFLKPWLMLHHGGNVFDHPRLLSLVRDR